MGREEHGTEHVGLDRFQLQQKQLEDVSMTMCPIGAYMCHMGSFGLAGDLWSKAKPGHKHTLGAIRDANDDTFSGQGRPRKAPDLTWAGAQPESTSWYSEGTLKYSISLFAKRFPVKLGPRARRKVPGSKHGVERTENQHRRPMLKPFRDDSLARPPKQTKI